jgi:hypothetical protein
MNQRSIITHAVLVGLTPLIPIPGLDDLVKSFFTHSLIRSLAAASGLLLSEEEVTALSEDQNSGCMKGCVLGLVEYYVKRLVRKMSVVLEWHRSVELVTHTYYSGHLLEYAFQEGWYIPGDVKQATRLRFAIEQAYRSANTEFVKRAVQSSFKRSSKLVLSAVRQVTDSLHEVTFRRSRVWLRQRAPGVARWLYRRESSSGAERTQVSQVESAVADKLEQASPRVRTTLNDLITQLHGSLTSLPDGHFDLLHARLEQALRQAEA